VDRAVDMVEATEGSVVPGAPHPPGALPGVDVFFVVSGFVITGMLVAQHERSGVWACGPSTCAACTGSCRPSG
jgi:hypothetical protein